MSHSMKSVSLLLYQGRKIRRENTVFVALQRCSWSVDARMMGEIYHIALFPGVDLPISYIVDFPHGRSAI